MRGAVRWCGEDLSRWPSHRRVRAGLGWVPQEREVFPLPHRRLEQKGLIERSPSGGYQMCRFTSQEIADAIRVRGVVEGFAARLLAEDGASRQLLRELDECLEARDKAVNKPEMDLDDYTAYVEMNDRFYGDLFVIALGKRGRGGSEMS